MAGKVNSWKMGGKVNWRKKKGFRRVYLGNRAGKVNSRKMAGKAVIIYRT